MLLKVDTQFHKELSSLDTTMSRDKLDSLDLNNPEATQAPVISDLVKSFIFSNSANDVVSIVRTAKSTKMKSASCSFHPAYFNHNRKCG